MSRRIALPFDVFAQEWLGGLDASPNTIRSWGSAVRCHLAPFLKGTPLGAIGPDTVQAALENVQGSTKTRACVLAAARACFAHAVRLGYIQRNPAAGLRVKVRPPAVRALTPHQAGLLDEALLRMSGCSRSLRLLLATGLRVSELLSAQLGDFDHVRNQLHVRKAKTRAGERIVDVPDRVAHLVVPVLRGSVPCARTLQRALDQACHSAAVPRVTLHELRHTRITSLLLAGVPVGYVSQQAGHSSPAFTLRVYDQWVQVADQDVRRKWANA